MDHRSRPSVLIGRDVGEHRLGHLHRLDVCWVALRVDLDVHRDRGPADARDVGVEGYNVADEYRLLKHELVYGNRRDTPPRMARGQDAARDVDLRHDPAAE